MIGLIFPVRLLHSLLSAGFKRRTMRPTNPIPASLGSLVTGVLRSAKLCSEPDRGQVRAVLATSSRGSAVVGEDGAECCDPSGRSAQWTAARQERGRLARPPLSRQPIAPRHSVGQKTGEYRFSRTCGRDARVPKQPRCEGPNNDWIAAARKLCGIANRERDDRARGPDPWRESSLKQYHCLTGDQYRAPPSVPPTAPEEQLAAAFVGVR